MEYNFLPINPYPRMNICISARAK